MSFVMIVEIVIQFKIFPMQCVFASTIVSALEVLERFQAYLLPD